MTGIYKITSPSNKVYIGSSININNRIKYYKSLNCKGQTKLYNSLKKYGFNNHNIEILELCDLSVIYQRERYYGDLYDVLNINGLNLILPKNNEEKIGASKETKKKMSDSKKGELNSFYGKKHTVETRRKISLSKIGKTPYNKGKKGHSNLSMSKIILNIENGVFYNSIKECSDFNLYNYSTLRAKLNGSLKNDTKFIYA